MNHKESKSTPTHVVAVIGNTHLDSAVITKQRTPHNPKSIIIEQQ